MRVKIYIDGDFLQSVKPAHVDSALDAIDHEYCIADTTWTTDTRVDLTTESDDEYWTRVNATPVNSWSI